MVPFYIYYSMFGYQRVGDLVWAAGDSRTRGFLLGGTAGRTTLNGEGLQHEDGHSHVLFSVVPNCRAYDPTFGYEVAVIIQDGLRRMVGEQEDVFYYLTLMNENYLHPPMPEGAEEGILRGMYLLRDRVPATAPRVQLLGSGTILREVLAAAELLESDFGVAADVWSVTSFTELRRDGIEVERWNMLHPLASEPRRAYVTESCLAPRSGRRLDRLHPRVRRPDPPVGARPLPRARHRRLRPQRLPRGAAAVLRGRPPLRRRRRAEGARRRRVARRRPACRRRSSATRSTPTRRCRRRYERDRCGDLGRGPRHRRLRRRPGHRDPRLARRHGRRRGSAASRSSPTRRRWTCRRRSPA